MLKISGKKIIALIALYAVLAQATVPFLALTPQQIFAQEATPTVAPSPTDAPSSAPTVTQAPAPTVTQAPAPTVTQAPAPTVTPSATPTDSSSPAPTITPTPSDTAPPTPTPAPVDTITPTPTPAGNLSPPTTVQNSATLAPAIWQANPDGSQTTISIVSLNQVYKAPQNDKVTVTFTKLPASPGKLTITEVKLTADQQKASGALSDTAYNITSDMANGTFQYDLTLPVSGNTQGKTLGVKSSETVDGLKTSGVNQANQTTGNVVTITGLNHFTIFVVVYNATPSVTPQTSYPSLGFQATQTSEFGDYVHLSGTARVLNRVTVTMVTWAKFSDYSTNPTYMGNSTSWTHPITINIYSAHLNGNGIPDELLATTTQTTTIPWRPADNPSCSNPQQWMDGNGNCNNGYAFNATFDMSGLNVTLPDDIIVGIAYNTQSYGTSPIGINGPYNSLNVAVPDNQVVSVGNDDSVDQVFWNTVTKAWYTDGGASGFGVFRKDTNWTPNGTVAFKVETTNSTAACNGSTFDSFNLGSVNSQGGWTITGPYEQAVVDNTYGYSNFGCKTLRISDSITSGSFGDQLFAPPTVNGVGEASATAGSFSVGTRQNHFEAKFDIASTMLTQQPGLHLSVSPDRGDGSRMSYLRFEDQSDGIHVFFDDVTDMGPVGTAATWNESDIDTISRTPHTIKLTLDTLDGPGNDIVKVYIDGVLVKTGTSWEDYYRYDPEASAEQSPRIVKTVLFRQARTSVPADKGNGFLIDNFSSASTTVSANPTTNPATNITLTGATLNGTNGGIDATGHSFWVSLAPFSTSSSTIPSGVYSSPDFGNISANTPFSVSLSSITTTGIPSNLPAITPGTTYYYVAWSLVGGTWYPGAVKTFTTDPLILPKVPTNGQPNNSYENTNNFYFTWNDSTGTYPVTYEFQSSGSNAIDGNGSLINAWNSIKNGNSEQNNLTTPTIHSTGAPDGTYYWQVRAIDSMGNKSAWSQAWKMTIDTIIPSVPTILFTANSINIPTNGYTNSKTFTFHLSSSNDVTRYQLKYWNAITGSTFKINSPWNPTDLSAYSSSLGVYNDNFSQGEGTHYFAFSACDAAGNCSPYSTPFVITYDKTAPVVSITSPTTATVSGILAIDGTVTDANPDHYWLVIQNSSNQILAGPNTVTDHSSFTDKHFFDWDTTSVPYGQYTIKLEARDAAGNKDAGSSDWHTVLVDNPPVIFDESFQKTSDTSLTAIWTTDHPSTSRVIYDTVSHPTLGSGDNYGYAFSTGTLDTSPKVTSHTVIVTGLLTNVTYYFRDISTGSPETVGKEQSYTISYVFGLPGDGKSDGGSTGGGGTPPSTQNVLGASTSIFADNSIAGNENPGSGTPTETPTSAVLGAATQSAQETVKTEPVNKQTQTQGISTIVIRWFVIVLFVFIFAFFLYRRIFLKREKKT